MEKELFFEIVRVDDNLVDLFFDTPAETKTAYRAIMNVLGDDAPGVRLIAKPKYAIILDRSQGGWRVWQQNIMRLVSDKILKTEGKYSIVVRNGSLISKAERERYLPMIVDV